MKPNDKPLTIKFESDELPDDLTQALIETSPQITRKALEQAIAKAITEETGIEVDFEITGLGE